MPFTFEELVAFCGILLIFWVVGKSVEKFGLPSLVGEILAGIAVGPHGLNIAPKPDALMMVGEFGLVLMLSLIHISSPRDYAASRMPSSA